MRSLFVTSLLIVLAWPGQGARGAADAAPDYETVVAPLLTKYCAGCHNDADREGDFSLESYDSLTHGLVKGPALLPGQPDSSRMIRVITGDADPQMPPDGEPQLSAEQVEVLKAWIAAGASGPADTELNQMRLVVPEIAPQTDTRPIADVDVSPDGQWLAVASYQQVTLQPLPQDSAGVPFAEKDVRTIGEYPGKVTAVHFSSDGRQLVTASGVVGLGGVAAIWDVATGELVREFRGHRDVLYGARLSPDGRVLATCSYDRDILLWDAETGERLRTLSGHNGAVYDIDFSPDSEFLVSASADDTCKVWRVSDGLRLDTLGQPLSEQYACRFSPNGNFIVAGGADNRLRVWRFVSRRSPRINPLIHARFAHEGAIVGLEFAPDGRRLVSLSDDRSVKVWETRQYRELSLEELDDVAMAMAVAPGRESIVLGTLNGRLIGLALSAVRSIDVAQPVNAIGAQPMPLPADIAVVDEQEPNDSADQAQPVVAPVSVQGRIHRRQGEGPDSDFLRFTAQAGQEWVIEVDADRSGSPLDSFVEVRDAQGERIERVLLESLRDSYFTFRGKNADQVDDFRVFNWEEMELNEFLYANGEVVRLWLYPRGPDSGFNVYPGSGQRWGYFDTTPLAHSLGEPCYIVQPHPPGTTLVPNGLPVFPLYHENDDESRRKSGKDSKLLFAAPADGEYVVIVRDVRGYQGEDFRYTLTVRPRRPDFRVQVDQKALKIAPGSAGEFQVSAEREDWFDGPIRVDVSHVPDGFSVSAPIIIEEGQTTAIGVIAADDDAPAPSPADKTLFSVEATAIIGDQEVSHTAGTLGKVTLGESPQLLVRIDAAEGGARSVATDQAGPLEFEIAPGETIMLRVAVDRRGFDGEVSFGKEDAGRNLPHGLYVDNIGLNGLLLLSGQQEREFFITAAKWVPEQTRVFHLATPNGGGHASRPVVLHVRPATQVKQP